MNLALNGKYMSLQNLVWRDIPDFAIVTGLNGAGKSQLLNLIYQKVTNQWNNRFGQIIPSVSIDINEIEAEEVVLLQGQWVLNDLQSVGLQEVQQSESSLYEEYINSISQLNQRLNGQEGYVTQQLTQFIKEEISIDKVYSMGLSNVKRIMVSDVFTESTHLVGGRIVVDNISQEDFYRKIPKNYINSMREQISNDKIGINFYKYYLNMIDAKIKNDLEKYDELLNKRPWNKLNSIFESIGLSFFVSNPEDLDIYEKYVPKLINKISNDVVLFSTLSSGEKVLVSLVFWLFNTDNFKLFPRLVLLDEPDAHLHPSMSKQFLYVLNDVLRKEYNVKIIATTHSPSTIALAPEESVFLLSRNGTDSVINKASKDSAISVLLSGVPALSLSYENRRQVFVESMYDVACYEMIYEKLKDKLVPEISISFISSGIKGKGDCNHVIEVVTNLVKNGNNSIYGLIDWDANNDDIGNVFVLGKGQRYSLENYIFDPFIVFAYLWREKELNNSEFGLFDNFGYSEFNRLTDENIQNGIDLIMNKLIKVIDFTKDEKVKVKYLSSKEFYVPKSYLSMQGHALESALKQCFDCFKRFHREGDLKKEMVKKIIYDLPSLLPNDLLLLMQRIQNAH